MKPKIKLVFTVVFILSISCNNLMEEPAYDSELTLEEEPKQMVGFTELAPDNPMVIKAIQSLASKLSEISPDSAYLGSFNRFNRVNEVGIFQYENDVSALAFNFENARDQVFVQILDSGAESDFILANYNNLRPIDTSRPSISFRSINTGEEFFYNTRDFHYISERGNLRGWGKCMKESIDKLFDDWEEEPVATLGCWILSPFCVIGAGLGCAIKELVEQL